MYAIDTNIPGAFFLTAAKEAGDHLVQTAVWDKTRTYCNWLGARDIVDAQTAKYAKRVAALSPEFYSGSAGVASFLLELYHSTQDEKYLATALGGWFRSVHYMQVNEFPASPISFYAGELGLIYVGYRFLEVNPGLAGMVEPHLNKMIQNLPNGFNVNHSLDVIGGNAGAIPVMLQLKRQYNLDIFEETALKCAEELLELGYWKDDMCIWASKKVHGVELETPPVTGYSHGASGIAVCLLEVFHHTGNKQYLKYGRGAFAFENSLFNPDEGNWIDTRYPHVKRDGKITGTFRKAWCHGAPGIALANLRAAELDTENSDFYLNMAEIAINTTCNFLIKQLKTAPEKDATLCHGILGLSDIIYTYARKTDKPDLISFSQETTFNYVQNFPQIYSMPSGIVAGGYNPCMMVGLSGIGLHCLKLQSKETINGPLIIVL